AVCSARRCWRILRLRLFQAQGVEVFLGHARQALVSCDGVASSEALRDHTLRSRGDRSLLSARNLDCLTIAAQCEFSVLVHGFLSLSFRAKSRNLSIHLDSGSSCRRPEKVLNYYATN